MSSATTTAPKSSPWIPLESNPDVFNKYAEKLGILTSQDEFVDVFGLDEELLDMVPKPVKAVVLVFPITKASEERRLQEDERIAKEGQPKLDPTLYWIKQTIPNACGTIGLIHALANSNIQYGPSSALQKFVRETRDKTPDVRAAILEKTTLFASVHAEAASGGQSSAHIDTDLHYTCFVQAPDIDFRRIADGIQSAPNPDETNLNETGMRLIELDGRRAGPVDHGVCHDLLKDAISEIRKSYMSASSSLTFSIMALSSVTGW